MSILAETTSIPAVHVLNSEDGSSKPWQVKCADAGPVVTLRAAVNFPIRSFATREEAIEVANKISNLFGIEEIEETPNVIDDDVYATNKIDDQPVRDPHVDYGDNSSRSEAYLDVIEIKEEFVDKSDRPGMTF